MRRFKKRMRIRKLKKRKMSKKRSKGTSPFPMVQEEKKESNP